jgi:DNA-binding protein YbaB
VAEDLGFGTEALDRLLADTRRTLESMTAARPDNAAEPDEVRGTGEASDGQVRATVVSAGEVESLRIDPRLLRLGSEALSEQVMLAVNAAFADHRARASGPTPDAPVDPQQLAGQLRDLQDQSVRSMAAFSTAMADVLSRIRRDGR